MISPIYRGQLRLETEPVLLSKQLNLTYASGAIWEDDDVAFPSILFPILWSGQYFGWRQAGDPWRPAQSFNILLWELSVKSIGRLFFLDYLNPNPDG